MFGPVKPINHADAARSILDVDHCAVICRRNPDGRVLGAGRGAADQERHLEALTFHFPGDVNHLVKRGRDEAAQADHVGLPVASLLQ